MKSKKVKDEAKDGRKDVGDIITRKPYAVGTCNAVKANTLKIQCKLTRDASFEKARTHFSHVFLILRRSRRWVEAMHIATDGGSYLPWSCKSGVDCVCRVQLAHIDWDS